MCRYFSFSWLKVKGEKCSSTPWRHLFWSFEVLETGVWPAADANGGLLHHRAGEPLAPVPGDDTGKHTKSYLNGHTKAPLRWLPIAWLPPGIHVGFPSLAIS